MPNNLYYITIPDALFALHYNISEEELHLFVDSIVALLKMKIIPEVLNNGNVQDREVSRKNNLKSILT